MNVHEHAIKNMSTKTQNDKIYGAITYEGCTML